MKTRRLDIVTTIRTEGGLLPAELLAQLSAQTDVTKGDIPGLTPDDYHLTPGDRVNEAVGRAWNRAQTDDRVLTEHRYCRLPKVFLGGALLLSMGGALVVGCYRHRRDIVKSVWIFSGRDKLRAHDPMQSESPK